MTGYLMIAAVAGFGGWAYGRMQSRRIEDELRFDIEEMRARCDALKRRLREKGVRP